MAEVKQQRNDTLQSQGSEDQGVLTSLRYYDAVRASATNVVRPEDSTVDIFTDPNDGQPVALCHLSSILPFTTGDYKPFRLAFEDTHAIALAAHHLNTGDGSIVPELAGLNERCKVRFTTEFADSEFVGGATLEHVVEQTNREPGTADRLPCAFIGAYRSAVSIPMSLVTGLLGYPQISGTSTSAELDDKSQYPLFGRTLPSDAGNAIPLIIYLREIMQIQHLVVINVNDAYGNLYVEGMRNARDVFAPDMLIHQIPLDEGQNAIESAISSAKATKYRFVFAIVFTADTHDALMTEAYHQGIAGNGLHNWIFGDSFLGTLDNRSFENGSPLHLAYRGVGILEVTGGVAGFPEYDTYAAKMNELKNPTDLAYTGTLFPKHDHPNYGSTPPFIDETDFLSPITNGLSPFLFEAAVALGLSACNAISDDLVLTAEDHVAALRQNAFSSISGRVEFDPETGSRNPSSALYKVANYQEEESDGMVTFKPVITNLFQNSEWNTQDEYLFNDGSPTLPTDLPVESGGKNDLDLSILLGGAAAFAALLGVIVFLFYENKRKTNDSVWQVKRDEIKFSDPPKVLGRGTFGMVLLGEYRGTQVAVKRVIPPQHDSKKGDRDSTFRSRSTRNTSDAKMFDHSEKDHNEVKVECSRDDSLSGKGNGNTSWAGASLSFANSGILSLVKGKKTSRKSRAPTLKQLKEDFMDEMRYLSKLRHPCVTTVMGALIDKGDDPMLVMEFMDHGSLYDLLQNDTMIIEGEILLPILRDVSQGMRFLHSAKPQVIHGDLKAANIMVDSRFRAKVSDFGLSQKKNLGGTGTPFWMAPELLRRESSNTDKTDVYSFGVILYEVYSRKEPYEGESASVVLRLVADKKVNKRPPVPADMPVPIQSLMGDCLEEEPDKRPSFEETDIRLKRINADNANPAQAQGKSSQVSLFDIFPRRIAEALQAGKKVEAEHKDCVTIFFSDIVGFTNISAKLDPRKVAKMLDRLYQKFDELSSKHDLYKVETIGDSYMAVTNLVKDQPDDHCKRVACFAIDVLKAANDTLIDEDDPSKGIVNLRIGFHSGSVVADVVGNRNPRYCLFGDSVNTASRMESNSAMNRINCSKQSADILKMQYPDLPLRSRGEVSIKGKGKMTCYWVNENPSEAVNDVKERVEMKRQARLLEARINGWSKPGDIEKGGQLTTVSEGFERSSAEFSIDDRSVENASLDGESSEFVRLRGELQTRLVGSGSNLVLG